MTNYKLHTSGGARAA